MRYDPQAISAATRAMCRALYGDNFDLHDHGAQDPEGRAHQERAAEAAIEAYLAEAETENQCPCGPTRRSQYRFTGCGTATGHGVAGQAALPLDDPDELT